MAAFLELVAQGKVTPKPLVTHRFAIADAAQAYALMERGEPHLAMLLTYAADNIGAIERRICRAKASARVGGNRIAFIGLGNYAKSVLLPILRKTKDVTLTTVVTASGISASHAGETYGFRTIATDHAAALADAGTDTIFIATRHDSHAKLTAEALRAGKHVFCEKPLALEPEGLSHVTGAIQEAPGILTVGFNRRFAPLLVKAKAAIEPRSGPLVMLYRINAGAVPADHWIQREEGGGRIIGEVCHFVDVLTFLAGSLPVEVHAVAARDHADAVSALIRFADGSTGTIVYSSLGDSSAPKEYIEVLAQDRVIRIDDFVTLEVTKRGKTAKRKAAQDKGQTGLIGAFLAATRDGGQPPIPLAELIAVTEATFAIEESLCVGSPVLFGRAA
jgi:polar amino acid transport system substrate-binding protein